MGRCPAREQLASLLAERLGGAEADAVTAHVETCPRCQATLDELSGPGALPPAPTLGREAPASEPRAEFLHRLRANTPPAPTWAARPDGPPPLSGAWPRVAGYEILGELGRGGMGVVYRARHRGLGRLVALKMLLGGAHATPQDAARFRAEAEVVARLQHPNVVQVYEVGESEGCPFLALEHVEGGSLAQRLRGAPLPVADAARLVETLARAVHAAHERGVVHRDLKPANVLLTADGTPKVTDFGLARRLDAREAHTQTGAVLGTPDYMAPEQAEGRAAGPAADVHALGAILYQLLTGRAPFVAEAPLDTLVRLRSEDAVSPALLQPGVPRDLATVCLKCLRKAPAERYGSAADLAGDLRRFLAGEPVRARPTPAWERAAKWVRRRPALAALGAVSVAAAVAVVASLGALWRNAEARAKAVQQLDLAKEEIKQRQDERARLEDDIKARGGDLARARTEVERLQQALPAARLNVRRALYIRDMHQAETLLRKEQLEPLVALLDRHRPPPGEEDVRGPEWHHLWRLCHGERLALRGHPEHVRLVRLSPDGKTVASVAGNGGLKLWDATGGAELRPPWGAADGVVSLAYSPDGRAVAVGRQDGVLEVWDAATDERRASAPAHAGRVCSVAFAPDGHALATGGQDAAVKVWRLPELSGPAALTGHDGPVWQAEFTPDGRGLVTVSEDNTARLWDLGGARGRFTFRPRGGAHLTHTALSPDGGTLATAEAYPYEPQRAGAVRLWSPASGEEKGALEVPAGGAWGMAFTPDGRSLAVGDNNGAVKLWDLAARQARHTFLGNVYRVHSVAFSRDGRTMATGGNDRTVRLWEVGRPAAPLTWRAPVRGRTYWAGRGVAFAPDGNTLAAYNAHGQVWLLDRRTGREETLSATHGGALFQLAFSPDSAALATVGVDGVVRLWDIATRTERAALPGSAAPVLRVAFAPDGTALALADRSGGVRLWHPAGTGREEFRCAGHAGEARALVFSPDGRVLASGGSDFTVRLWDRATGRPLAVLKAPGGGVMSLAFSPDGKLLAAGDYGGALQLWDVAALGPPHSLGLAGAAALGPASPRVGALTGLALTAAVYEEGLLFSGVRVAHALQVAFAPDGKTLFVAGGQSGAKFWDVTMREERFTLRGPSESVESLALSPDGAFLATGGRDDAIHVWDVGPAEGGERAFVPGHGPRERQRAWHRREAEEAEQRGQWFGAAWHLDRLVELGPVSASLRTRRARALLAAGRPERALADLTDLVRAGPDDPGAWFNRGWAHACQGRWGLALADHARAAELAPDDGAIRLSVAVAHAVLGEQDRAADAYARAAALSGALRLRPDVGWGARARGAPASALGHWQVAAEGLARLPEAPRDVGWASRARGLAAAARGRWPEAAADFRAAAAKKADDAEAWYGLVRALEELEQWEEAAAAAARLTRLRPGDGGAWYLRGVAEGKLYRSQRAEASLSRAIELGVDGWAVRGSRGNLHAERGRWGPAREDMEQAARMAGRPAWMTSHLALLRLRCGDRPGHRAACVELLRLLEKADDPDAAVWAARACVVVPDLGEDLRRLTDRLQWAGFKNPNTFYDHRVGPVHYRAGQFAEAVKELSKARAFHESVNQGTAHECLFLALACHRLGRAGPARRWLDEACRQLDRGPPAKDWYDRLELEMLRREAEALLPRARP